MPVPKSHLKSQSGQALIETAVVFPILLCVILNAVNFAYFFIIAVNVASSPRTAATYGIMGPSTPAGDIGGLPDATPATATSNTVAALAYEDLHGALSTYAVDASVQVCSQTVLVGVSGINGTGSSVRTNCVVCSSQSSCGSGQAVTTGSSYPGPWAPSPDPQPAHFRLHRVDVTYKFSPLIPGTIFNLALLPSTLYDNSISKYHFHRQVSMRAMD